LSKTKSYLNKLKSNIAVNCYGRKKPFPGGKGFLLTGHADWASFDSSGSICMRAIRVIDRHRDPRKSGFKVSRRKLMC